jgi:DNA invertase Pin-like site-specific DNA recombinase
MPSTKNIRAAIYARVSTTDQFPENQIEEIRRVADSRGWLIVAEHVDHGVSGSTDRRPGLDALLQQVERREVDVVIVVRLDRLGRSLQHLLSVVNRITAAEVGLVSIRDSGVDTTTASGKLMLSILGAFAAFERDILVERTRAGMDRVRRQGVHVGRPRREVAVGAALELLGQGHSLTTVARMLGIPRPTLSRRLQEVEGGTKGCPATPIAKAA